ncbi:MAG: hypothetical protein AB1757_18715 [Acidobacteriota bacterium]
MKKTRRAKITIEKERLWLISRRPSPGIRCQLCQVEVKMVDLQEAAAIAKASQRELFRRVENGSLHFAENADGTLLICLASLRQNFFGCE